MTSFTGIVSLLLKGHRESADGEDRYYILGNKLGEFFESEYYSSSCKFSSLFNEIQKLNISKKIEERRQFLNGLEDSFCSPSIMSYICLNLSLYEQNLIIYPKILIKPSLESENFTENYNLVYALLPIEDFIDNVCRRFACYSEGKFYFRQPEKTVIDPWLLSCTVSLCNKITDFSIPLFKTVYKSVYNDNVYRDSWMTNPFLKQFKDLYRNIEIASMVFDLNHILRKKIINFIPFIEDRKEGREEKEEKEKYFEYCEEVRQFDWALMSTRIHYGIPAIEFNNFFEYLFEPSSVEKMSLKWFKNYLSGIQMLSKEYTPSPRFKSQVQEEVKSIKRL